ncbi:MAG: peptidoglycan bridge formation glycyltransferase FemA/FemB family protein [Solobacterium sp.]|nr:peptidoglycan bridge formation glycyltransferase FemA/FemB family protein [Solobacterium sp.]
MNIRVIKDRELFDAFVSDHPNAHYMKTSMWGEFKKINEGLDYRMLGFYEGDALIATAMVLEKKGLFPYFYIPKGPCMDYEDKQTRRKVFELLKAYSEENNVVFLRMDPNVVRAEKDIKGNLVEGGFSHEDVTEDLKQEGYVHRGYNYAYDGSWTNRFTLIVDISDDIDTVFNRFAKNRKYSIRRNDRMKMVTRVGDEKDIDALLALQKQLSEIKGFKPSTRKDFENILHCFKDNVRIYVTEMDIDASIEALKATAKTKEEKESAEKQAGELLEYKEAHSAHPVLAAGLFYFLNDTCWTVYYYADKGLPRYSPLDSLNFEAMKDMKKEGVKYYDLCGFSGVVDKEDPEYQLYEYKHRFAPVFTEHIGEFDFINRPKAMKNYRLAYKVENRLKRQYHILRYKKTKA